MCGCFSFQTVLTKFVLWVLQPQGGDIRKTMTVKPGLAQVWWKTVCLFPDFFYGSPETPTRCVRPGQGKEPRKRSFLL